MLQYYTMTHLNPEGRNCTEEPEIDFTKIAEGEIQNIVDTVGNETLILDENNAPELQEKSIQIIGNNVETGEKNIIVVTPQIASSYTKSLQKASEILRKDSLSRIENAVTLGIIDNNEAEKILSDPSLVKIPSLEKNLHSNRIPSRYSNRIRGANILIIAGMILTSCKVLPNKKNNEKVLDLPQSISYSDVMTKSEKAPVEEQQIIEAPGIIKQSALNISYTDTDRFVAVEKIKNTSWGESGIAPLLSSNNTENLYDLVPDFYYKDILPNVIDDIQEICRNDTDKAKTMILTLPAVSHLGDIISISNNEEYNKNLELVKLGRYLLDKNLDPGKYLTTGASDKNISVSESVAKNLPQIIDSIYKEYEQEKHPDSDFTFVFKIADGYRDFNRQQQARETAGKSSAARPGESQHHTGLAFDAYYTSSQWDITKKLNKYGVVSPFMDEKKSGMVDPPHFFYLDGYMPGLTQIIMDYYSNNGMDPMNVNDINVINQILLGISQTFESELSEIK